jgi:cold shock CspA family protein
MNVPLEISYRDVEKTDELESLIREKTAKLEDVCDYISSVRVAVELAQKHHKSGNPVRVRLDITVPPGNELVVEKEPKPGDEHINVGVIVRRAFEAAWRQLRELKSRQHDEVKKHPEQEAHALVDKLFPDKEYGFLKTTESGRELYFHKNSVLHNDFTRLEVGTGVHYAEEMGEDGPQATSVKIVDKPGVRSPKTG